MIPQPFSAQNPIKLLVGTNIWLDYFLARSSHHKAVAEFIGKATEREDIVLFVTSLSLKDIAYLLASQMKQDVRNAEKNVTADIAAAAREVSWACVRDVLDKALVAPIGSTEVLSACTLRHLHDDFEDDLILAATEASGAHGLMTHDRQLAQHASQICISAEEGLELLAELDAQPAD